MKKKSWRLTRAQKEELIALYLTGEWTQSALGEKYGVAQVTIAHHIRAAKRFNRDKFP